MLRTLLSPFTILAVLAFAPFAPADLEVSLTVTGDIDDIRALLGFIEERNRGGGDGDPMKINVHSVAGGESGATATPEVPPVKLHPPQWSAEKLTPGQPALVSVAVRDEREEVDTIALHVVGTNLKTDLYDDGSHGDVKANDGVWSVSLTPLEATPAGTYDVIVTGFDGRGRALQSKGPDGERAPLEVRTEVLIER